MCEKIRFHFSLSLSHSPLPSSSDTLAQKKMETIHIHYIPHTHTHTHKHKHKHISTLSPHFLGWWLFSGERCMKVSLSRDWSLSLSLSLWVIGGFVLLGLACIGILSRLFFLFFKIPYSGSESHFLQTG